MAEQPAALKTVRVRIKFTDFFKLNCGSDVVLNPLEIHFVFATPHDF